MKMKISWFEQGARHGCTSCTETGRERLYMLFYFTGAGSNPKEANLLDWPEAQKRPELYTVWTRTLQGLLSRQKTRKLRPI